MNTYVLLWSKSQNCFHIEPMAELLKKNNQAFATNATLNDYHVIDYGSQEQLTVVANMRRYLLRQRDGESEATS